jgi:hypothetical protein
MKSIHTMTMNLATCLVSLLLVSCSPSPPAALSEEKLLEGLAEMVQHGPFQFKEKTWPLLVDKTVTYCGTIAEVEGTDADSSVTLNVEKTHAGEAVPWSLEGKSNSPELAREYKVGDAICMTGIFESYVTVQYYKPPYRGTVKLASWEKPATS